MQTTATRRAHGGKDRTECPIPNSIPGLDGLRAFSILLVMASHSGMQRMLPGLFGVTVFFFISGFLITALLVREMDATGRISLRQFYMRRFLRLYPPLLVFVGITSAVWLLLGRPMEWLGVFAALTYLTNYLAVFDPSALQGIGGQLWSLAVEEHFYLVYPLLLIALFPRRLLTLKVLLALCALSLAIRTGVVLSFGAHGEDYASMATECRVDAILFGSATALAVREHGRDFVERWTEPHIVAAACAAILATFLIRDGLFRETVRYTIQQAALVPLVLAVTLTARYGQVNALLNSRPMVHIGKLSYSLYLWHLAGLGIGHFVLPGHGVAYAGAVLIGWTAAFLLAMASYRFVEAPCFALRRRFGSSLHEAAEAQQKADAQTDGAFGSGAKTA
ncbi:MAG: acyltransferase family protein [Beijerinckiaceae bacterium]